MRHVPVLLQETLALLDPKSGETFIDATFGAGGHALQIAEKVGSGGQVLGIDANAENIAALVPVPKNLTLAAGNFSQIAHLAKAAGITSVDGILFDLGLSTDILDDSNRGFSFETEGPLDMRFGGDGMTAAEFLNSAPSAELHKVLRTYGEEKNSKRITRLIEERRRKAPFKTTFDLRDAVLETFPEHLKKSRQAYSSLRRVFQAVRIQVNNELEVLESALQQSFQLLKKDGRLVVISYHSLEDRVVKNFFKDKAKGCICPPDFPVCLCGRNPQMMILTKKPVTPMVGEQEQNSRSKPAKLRAAKKL